MILYIRGTSAGVVQRLVRGLAKAETWVRFPSLAPEAKIVAPSDVND